MHPGYLRAGQIAIQFSVSSYLLCFTVFLRMPLSPHLRATRLHYHQLHEGVSILGQRTLSKGTFLYDVGHHLPLTILALVWRGQALLQIGCRQPCVRTEAVQQWPWANSKPGCRTVGSDTSALLATIAESQTSCHLVFISEGVKSNHSGFMEGLVGGPANTSLWTGQSRRSIYLLYEKISCGFTSQVTRCNIGENW